MRLIDATELEREWERIKAKDQYNGGGYLYSPQDLLDSIEEAETIEAEPVKHGRWKYYHKQNIAVCTNCSFERDLDANFGKAVSCPNCGAKMDLEG